MIYLTAECNYGGRVTDDKDRRLIVTILRDYYNEKQVYDENYVFTVGEMYKMPMNLVTHDSMVEW